MKNYVRVRTFIAALTALLTIIAWLVVQTCAAHARIHSLERDLQWLRETWESGDPDGERIRSLGSPDGLSQRDEP